MTNNGKKIACVALASALCLGVGFSAVLPPLNASADTISYNQPAFDSSSPLYLGQFGTITAKMHEEGWTGGDVYMSTALPLFSGSVTSLDSSDFVLDGYDVGSTIVTDYDGFDTSLHLQFIVNDGYEPTSLDEWSALTFSLRDIVLDKEVFQDICESTFVYMPVGFNYSAALRVEYLTSDGSYSVYSNTVNNLIYATEDLVTASTRKSLYEIMGAPGNFWVQPAFIELDEGEFSDYLYVIRQFTLDIYPAYDNQSATNSPNYNIQVFVPATEYTWLDYLDYQDMYERYSISRYSADIIPAPADILFSPVEAFFAAELFEGFTLGNLLAIALGCLLFGLFLKIFAGG